MEKTDTYIKLDSGDFAPTSDPDSEYKRISSRSRKIVCWSNEWAVIHNVSGFDQSKEPEMYTLYRDEPHSTRLKCVLESNSWLQSFHSIREEGTTRIDGPFTLDIVPIENVEIEGIISHRASEEAGHKDLLIGQLGIPKERMSVILEQLNVPDAHLHVSLSASFFVESPELDDFYVPFGKSVPILEYEIYVAYGPGYQKLVLQEEPEEDTDEGLFDVKNDPSSEMSFEQDRELKTRDKRIDYIIVLLILMVALQFLQLV